MISEPAFSTLLSDKFFFFLVCDCVFKLCYHTGFSTLHFFCVLNNTCQVIEPTADNKNRFCRQVSLLISITLSFSTMGYLIVNESFSASKVQIMQKFLLDAIANHPVQPAEQSPSHSVANRTAS